MNVFLLGGSNSVMTYGLRSGLKSDKKVNLNELALGATSSLQNLYALIKNNKLIKTANLIITESNVNDAYNILNINIELDFAFENIDRFYSELSSVECRVCVLLIPHNYFLIKNIELIDIAKQINSRHLLNIKKFGFDFIDLQESIQKQLNPYEKPKEINVKETYSYLIPDPRHPKIDLMHDLGEKIIDYYSKMNLKLSNYKQTEDYTTLLSNRIDANIENKTNNRFSIDYVKIDRKYFFPKEFFGYRLLGISTWGEGRLKITSRKKHIVKSFNEIYSFNEILEEMVIDEDTYFENTSDLPTEKSVNTTMKNCETSHCHLEGFLLTKIEKPSLDKLFNNKKESINLEFIVPELFRYIADSKLVLKGLSKTLPIDNKIDNEKIGMLRDTAIFLEKIDIEKAYELMKLAKQFRPKGHTICKKVDQYEKIIANIYYPNKNKQSKK